MEINIYIELDSMSPKTTEGYYGYVLEWKTKTREGFGKNRRKPGKKASCCPHRSPGQNPG